MIKKIIIGLIIFLVILVVISLFLFNRSRQGNTVPGQSFSFNQSTSNANQQSISPATSTSSSVKTTTYVDNLKKTGYESSDFTVTYSHSADKFVIEKKTAAADEAIRRWAQTNGLTDILINTNIFLLRNGNTFTSYAPSPTSALTNFAIAQLPKQQQDALNKAKQSLPFTTGDVSVNYLSQYDAYSVEKKSAAADAQLQQWAKQNNIERVVTNKSIFLDASPTPISTPPPLLHFDNTVKDFFQALFGQAASQQPTGAPSNQPADIGNIAGLISSYGLPAPQEAGYTALLLQLKSSANSSWATKELLDAERYYTGKGGNVKRYLTTAWIWFETGQSLWPDPYEINCNDNRSGFTSEVSAACTVSNFQIAGYQATTRQGDYARLFQTLFNPSQLQAILQSVVSNSSKATKPSRSYTDGNQQKGLVSQYLSSISQATLADISPNKNFSDPKTQFLTLILGKDPKMAIALNTFAVSDGDLVAALKSSQPAYGYIGASEKQLLSNMIAALYLFDTGGNNITNVSPIPFTSGTPSSRDLSSVVEWAGRINQTLEFGHVWSRYYNKQVNPPSNGSYTAFYRQGLNLGTSQTGIYWCTDTVIDAFNLAGFSGLGPAYEGVINMQRSWSRIPGFQYVAYLGANKQQSLSAVKAGCAIFWESSPGIHTGHEHTAIIKNVQLDTHYNGYLETFESNSTIKSGRYPIYNATVQNNPFTLVGFGCVQ